MVGTPVYKLVVRSMPSSAGVFPSHHPPAKTRVDKTTDCGNHNSDVVAQVGLQVTTPLILVPQSVLLRVIYLARLQEFVLHWPIVPEVVPRGPGMASPGVRDP